MKKLLLAISILIIILTNIAFAKSFEDTNNLHEAYIEAIDELSNKKIISGYPDGTFKPANTITRAEVVKMLVVAYDLKLDSSRQMSFSDTEGKWYEEYINIAASNDIIYGYYDGTVKPENSITYAELSALLNRLLGIHTETVREEGEMWHTNSWNASEDAGLFDNIATNDLLPDNKARRDNVALMLYNALNYKTSETPEATVKPADSGETAQKPTSDVDTNKIYFGVVDDTQLIRGRDTIDVDMFNDELMTFTVRNSNDPIKGGELMFLKLRKSGSVNILKELLVEDLNNAYMVEKVDSEEGYAKLKGETESLDLAEDSYVFGSDKITFSKMNFFEINVSHKKDEYKFASGTKLELEDISLEENDRIIVDASKKLFIIFKGLENDNTI